ncbi:MAG: mechanosensitive ion channel family protein [Colwellia sp.]|nr:mechanosensitive ion channel family protein [Colwellia sp.]
MNELLSTWLTQQGIDAQYLPVTTKLLGTFIILLIAALSYYLAKYQVLKIVKKVIIRTKNTWDDLLLEHKVFTNLVLLIPFIVILFLTPITLPPEEPLAYLLSVIARVAICFQVANSISAILNVVKSIYQQSAKQRYIPLNSAIQVIKLVVYLVATILALSYILDRSPIYLLSGLGALTAVLLLVFQDTIKGLVASIQISANRMVAPGDWVEIPQYGADGDVLEIGLNTVKIQNFDKTVTTVPTYALISGSFKNWRDMFSSGGRRIKRTITVDIASIEFYNQDQIDHLSKISLIHDYLKAKQQEISANNKVTNSVSNDELNTRQLTNIGTFRAYIEAYLKQHDKVHHQLTCMVRQLAATDTGLPLELYFFSNDQNWVNYEVIQADIFDHLFAMAPHFGIRIFQHPTGYDWHKNNQG